MSWISVPVMPAFFFSRFPICVPSCTVKLWATFSASSPNLFLKARVMPVKALMSWTPAVNSGVNFSLMVNLPFCAD